MSPLLNADEGMPAAAVGVDDDVRGAPVGQQQLVVVGLPTGEPGGLALNELINSHYGETQ